MPILEPEVEDQEDLELDDAEVSEDDALLTDESGNLTLEAETIALFMSEVDWDDLFDHEAAYEHIQVEEVMGVFVEDENGEEHLQTFRFTEDDFEDEGPLVTTKPKRGDQYEGRVDASTVAEAVNSLKSHTSEGSKEMRYYDHTGNLIPDPYQYKGMMYDKNGEKMGNGPMRGKPLMRGGQKGVKYDEAAHEYYDDKGNKIADPATYKGMMYDKSGKEMMQGPMKRMKKYASSGHSPMMSKHEYESAEYVDLDISLEDLPDGVDVFLIESLPGSVVAELVDMDDLMEMFAYYVWNLPEDSLEDRARKALFVDMFEDVDEAVFKKGKGAFRKKAFSAKGGVAPFKGAKPKAFGAAGKGTSAGHDQRVRQMLAMMHKGVISRVPSGTGYDKGDWKYGKAKGAATSGGKRKYAKYRVKNIGKIRKLVKGKVAKARNIAVKSIYKHIKVKKPKNWQPPEDRPDLGLGGLFRFTGKKKKKAKKGAGKLKAQAKKAKGKKKIAASDTNAPAANLNEDANPNGNLVSEGAGMAGRVVSHMKSTALKGEE